VLTTPVVRSVLVVREMARSRAGFFRIDPAFPASVPGRHHIGLFEACSSFTRVTACPIARPPKVDFVTRFRPDQFPGHAARQLSNLTINYSCGSFPHW
jgi:hypothetical protein